MHRRTAVMLGTFTLWACGSKAPEDANNPGDRGTTSGMATPDGGHEAIGDDAEAGAAPGATGDASGVTADAGDAASDARSGPDAVSPGWNLVAMDTAQRTYLDYVNVPASRRMDAGKRSLPALATWENQTTYSALRFQPCAGGSPRHPTNTWRSFPRHVARRSPSQSRTAHTRRRPRPPTPPRHPEGARRRGGDGASPAPPWMSSFRQGTFDYSAVLRVGADVRLRRFPEDTGGTLKATKPATGAIHLAGDRSGALFLVLNFGATARGTSRRRPGSGAATTAAPSCTTCSSWAMTSRSRPARMSSASPRREVSGPSTMRTTATPTRSPHAGIARLPGHRQPRADRGGPRRRPVRVRQLPGRRRRRARLRVHRELGTGRPRARALGRRRRVHPRSSTTTSTGPSGPGCILPRRTRT